MNFCLWGRGNVISVAGLEPSPSANQTGTKLSDRSTAVPVPTVYKGSSARRQKKRKNEDWDGTRRSRTPAEHMAARRQKKRKNEDWDGTRRSRTPAEHMEILLTKYGWCSVVRNRTPSNTWIFFHRTWRVLACRRQGVKKAGQVMGRRESNPRRAHTIKFFRTIDGTRIVSAPPSLKERTLAASASHSPAPELRNPAQLPVYEWLSVRQQKKRKNEDWDGTRRSRTPAEHMDILSPHIEGARIVGREESNPAEHMHHKMSKIYGWCSHSAGKESKRGGITTNGLEETESQPSTCQLFHYIWMVFGIVKHAAGKEQKNVGAYGEMGLRESNPRRGHTMKFFLTIEACEPGRVEARVVESRISLVRKKKGTNVKPPNDPWGNRTPAEHMEILLTKYGECSRTGERNRKKCSLQNHLQYSRSWGIEPPPSTLTGIQQLALMIGARQCRRAKLWESKKLKTSDVWVAGESNARRGHTLDFSEYIDGTRVSACCRAQTKKELSLVPWAFPLPRPSASVTRRREELEKRQKKTSRSWGVEPPSSTWKFF
ncbi:hypothetical protein B0H11DRAFT_2382390 [Mycena galericulata]|nr:hypothetical protein B0H11DRAFT_2382390 [Mycena galericulata]